MDTIKKLDAHCQRQWLNPFYLVQNERIPKFILPHQCPNFLSLEVKSDRDLGVVALIIGFFKVLISPKDWFNSNLKFLSNWRDFFTVKVVVNAVNI